MDNLIRTDTVFGKRVNMVGNISADLVLESLGKVYIKSRNKSLTLEELITSLVITDPNASTSKVEIVEGIENLDISNLKDGTFVFDKLNNILYLLLDRELLELINVTPEGTGYVKRSGDTMTGRLTIYVKDGPPLHVNSTVLVPNLNAQYLNGETAETFTKRNKDEKINGAWTFKNVTQFKSNIDVEKDIVINGNIGSPNFSSGFGGYGWRMDANTNTLTVDNLVVRKLMLVYELVINKISATNGSLWVSNAGKVISVKKVEVYNYSFFNLESYEYDRFCAGLRNGDVFIKMPEEISLENLDEEAFSTASGDGITVRNCYSLETLRNAKFIEVSKDSPTGQLFTDTTKARISPVFEEGFRFDCTFPIITRNNKIIYDNYLNSLEAAKTELVNLRFTQASLEVIDAKIEEINGYEENLNPKDYVSLIRSYYKYFAGGDFYYVKFDDNNIPVFKAGDLLRCQKWTYGGIKYYDAVVCNYVEKGYVIQLAASFLDTKTTITYNNGLVPTTTIEEDSRNLSMYKSTNNYVEPEETNRQYNDDGTTTILTYNQLMDKNLIGKVEIDDSLVQIGHLWNLLRLNAVYITSTDDASPYMDVLSGINRPDYSVIYHIPVYLTVKLYQASYDLKTFTGYNNLVEIPYTGDYYVQDTTILNYTCEYVCFKFNNIVYLAEGKNIPNLPGVNLLYYLNTIPDKCSLLGESSNFYINLEDEENDTLHILLEDGAGNLIQELQLQKLILSSTRTVKTRLGNLNGIQDELFPIDKLPYGYGLYGQNVFLTGEFYLSNGQSVADLGKEAMAFAISSSRVGNAAINLLRVDLIRATNLLKASHYNKGVLKTAGMYIGNDSNGDPGIVIWGNKILFATTDLEFDGYVQPTLLLSNGKIQGKYLNVDEAQGTVNAQVLTSEFTVNNVKYTSVDLSPGTVRVYRPKMLNIASNGKVYYTESDLVYYIRRFMLNNNDSLIRWLVVNPDGYPLSKDAVGNYDTITYLNFTYFNSDNEPVSYSDGNLPANVEAALINDYSTPLKVWALEKNGKGNLGGSTLYWNSTGKVVVNGILYSKEGNIGGLQISAQGFSTLSEGNGSLYNPLVISTQDYGYSDGELTSLPYIQLLQVDMQGTLRSRTVMTSGGLYYLAATLNTSTNTSWYNFETMQVPGTIFSLTLIPIISTEANFPTLYARYITNFKCFYYIDLTYDEGNFALNFHSSEGLSLNNDGVDWFVKQLYLGNILFLISGISCGLCNYDYNKTVNFIHTSGNPDTNGYTVNSRNGSDYMLWYMFNSCNMLDNPSIRFLFHEDESGPINATIKGMAFTGSKYSYGNGVNSNWLSDYNFSRRFTWGAKVSALFDWMIVKNYNDGGLYWIGSSSRLFNDNQFDDHVIWIQTADDSTLNWGGFTLTATYTPTFDSRFISNVETLLPVDYTDEDWDKADPTNS